MKRKTLFTFAAILFLTTSAWADKIVIAADPWCPYTCDPAEGSQGYLIDIARQVFEKAGHKVEYKMLPWTKTLVETRSGEVTGAAGATESDKEGLILQKAGLGSSQSCFYVKPDSTWNYSGVSSLSSITLGIIQGYTFNEEIDKYIATSKSKVDAAPGEKGMETNLKKLAAGRLGAYLDDKNAIELFKKKNKEFANLKQAGCLEEAPLSIGFSAKNPKSQGYSDLLEKEVEALRKSGELKKILDKYGLKDWK